MRRIYDDQVGEAIAMATNTLLLRLDRHLTLHAMAHMSAPRCRPTVQLSDNGRTLGPCPTHLSEHGCRLGHRHHVTCLGPYRGPVGQSSSRPTSCVTDWSTAESRGRANPNVVPLPTLDSTWTSPP